MARQLTFNVIFMPETVPFLCLGVQSLLKHSPYRFRLVSNALGPDELQMLRDFAESNPRLDFYAYPTRLTVDHGTLLTLLFHRTDDEYFCFLDSDIFAAGPFDTWLETQLDEFDAISSCLALFWESLPPAVGFSGRCTVTPNGSPLLSSFFAAYRRGPLQDVFDSGISFEKRMSPHHFSAHERALAEAEGWKGQMVDTAKLVNFELARRGHKLGHRECDQLLHIGGVSWWLCRAGGAARDMRAIPEVITDGDLKLDQGKETPLNRFQKQLKEARARWFSAHMYYLFGKAAPPQLDVVDPDLRSQIENVRDLISAAFTESEHLRGLSRHSAGHTFQPGTQS